MADIDSDVAKRMEMNRRKCRNVGLGVHEARFLEDFPMTQGMKMITDESTDISLLGAIVLCYSGRGGKVVSTFLDLKEIESGTVVAMAKVIKDLIISVQSDPMKLMKVVVVCGFF